MAAEDPELDRAGGTSNQFYLKQTRSEETSFSPGYKRSECHGGRDCVTQVAHET